MGKEGTPIEAEKFCKTQEKSYGADLRNCPFKMAKTSTTNRSR
jgi:hypothetical protein